MQALITQIRERLPFDDPNANVCTGQCNTCSVKLLEFMDNELLQWQQALHQGETPTIGDVHKLAKTATKVYRVLEKNNLVDPLE